MSHRSVFFLVYLLFLTIQSLANTNRYFVYFTDKSNSAYSVDQPQEFLTDRSVKRRTKFNIPFHLSDLPVNTEYVAEVQDLGAKVFYKSKWFNGVLIQASDTLLPYLSSMEFVQSVELVAPGIAQNNGRNSGMMKLSKRQNKVEELATTLQNDMLGVTKMHQDGFAGKGMLIGVFDAGFSNVDQISYFDHLFENEQIAGMFDFVDHDQDVFHHFDHGTEVLSCMAALDSAEYIGTAFQADYILCVTENGSEEYRIEEYNWVFAAEYADSLGVDIINASIGYNLFDDPAMNYEYEDMDGNTAIITKAASMAARKGILVVASAGNEANDPWGYITAPADADSILAVGAINDQMIKTFFSSFGPTADGRTKPDVSALGLGTITVNGTGIINGSNGTSFAAPLITGFAAGIWQSFPELNNIEIIELIKNAGSQSMSPDNFVGYGVPRFDRAVILDVPQPAKQQDFAVYPNPFKDNNFFIKPIKSYPPSFIPSVKIHNLSGELIHELEIRELKDKNVFQVDIPEIVPSGVYILAILTENKTNQIKIVKQ